LLSEQVSLNLEAREAREKLERLALSRLESKIYVELLLGGSRKASDLSKAIEANRIDVYRCLKQMRQRGILEVAFSKPFKFSAVDPEILFNILLSEQELSLRTFRTELSKVCEQLQSIPKRMQSEIPRSLKQQNRAADQFQLKQGRQVVEKWKKMVGKSKREILIVLSHVGLMTHSLEGFGELYSKVAQGGVTIKMITEVDKENLDQGVEFSKICNLKIADFVGEILRYVIIDDTEAMISSGYPSNDPKEFTAICTGNPLLVKSLRLDFKDKWRKAKRFSANELNRS
jgi:sugar-specific transcriptional regulator TrmB